jgi:nitrate reductase (cytochrome), electron transfer subunit
MQRVILFALIATTLLWCFSTVAAGLDGIYGPAPLDAELPAPPFPTESTRDQTRPRSFPEQPPTTPHLLNDDYKFGLTDNRCILCHSPSTAADMRALTHAPSVSPSHLVLRDRKIAAEITPGHRFCASCHVVQTEASPPIGNTFQASEPVPVKVER